MITKRTCELILEVLQYHMKKENINTEYVSTQAFGYTIETVDDMMLMYSTDLCRSYVNMAARKGSCCDEFYKALDYSNGSENWKDFEVKDTVHSISFNDDFESKYFQNLLLFNGSEDLYDCLVLRTFLEDTINDIEGHLSISRMNSSTEGCSVFEENVVQEWRDRILEKV